MSSASPEYVVVGNVTQDLQPDGSYQIGGTATYSAIAASRLGVKTAVLTSCTADLSLFCDDPDILICRQPARQSTTFENLYDHSGRTQYLRAEANALHPSQLPAAWQKAAIIHLGPIAHEVDPAFVDELNGSMLGVTPQGWFRTWNEEGLVDSAPYACDDRLVDHADAFILSPEDLGHDREALTQYIERTKLLVVTLGSGGAIIHQNGSSQRVPAFASAECDPTGAGDVFAAAFIIRLHETMDALEAARFANCAASYVIEGIGPANIPTREQVNQRLAVGERI